MGVVWAGRDEALGRDVAVKEVVLPLDLSAEDREKLRRRTLREARAAGRISSPAAVMVYDVVEEDGRPWIVMERLTARSLADVFRDEGPLSAARVAELGLDVLDALEAAASVGVLHRDIKPANVMLRSNGRAVLTDFGIATLEGDATITTTGLLLGSPAYMSPERARGERATLASDLWSLGATLYAALAGRSPFERSGTLPTLNAVLHDPTPSLPQAGEVGDVVNALLVKEPAGRPSLGEARAALQRLAARANREKKPLAAGADIWEGLDTTQTPGHDEAPTPTRRLADAADSIKHSVIESWLTEPEDRTPPTRRRRAGRVLLVLLIIAVVAGLGVLVGDWRSADPDAAGSESERNGGPQSAIRVQSPKPTAEAAADHPQASPSQSRAGTRASTSGASPRSSAGSSAPAAAALPAGFRLHTDPTGFTIAVPDGWVRSTEGPRTYFKEPGGRRFLLVDQTTEPKDDPLTDWQANEPSVAARLSGYERISLERVDYRGWNTADWEFTWDGSNGQIHVLNRNVRVSDHRAYALYWSIPESKWADSRGMFDVVAQSFQPAPD